MFLEYFWQFWLMQNMTWLAKITKNNNVVLKNVTQLCFVTWCNMSYYIIEKSRFNRCLPMDLSKTETVRLMTDIVGVLKWYIQRAFQHGVITSQTTVNRNEKFFSSGFISFILY